MISFKTNRAALCELVPFTQLVTSSEHPPEHVTGWGEAPERFVLASKIVTEEMGGK